MKATSPCLRWDDVSAPEMQGNTTGDVYVYDVSDGKRMAHVAPIKVSAPVKACGISPDCRHLLAAVGNGFIFRFEYRKPETEVCAATLSCCVMLPTRLVVCRTAWFCLCLVVSALPDPDVQYRVVHTAQYGACVSLHQECKKAQCIQKHGNVSR